ncbi:Domain of unknown function DUF3815 [Phaffia rhodozyma]|uniref:DUF1212-domain-containing protein n=1 Tax=Phaffia rhodozyma TaxID=264483 RepID=A0A0F7SSW4_PHARH|nr:Domain of unknown function DUF3815 [Phaffia rhodozyma]
MSIPDNPFLDPNRISSHSSTSSPPRNSLEPSITHPSVSIGQPSAIRSNPSSATRSPPSPLRPPTMRVNSLPIVSPIERTSPEGPLTLSSPSGAETPIHPPSAPSGLSAGKNKRVQWPEEFGKDNPIAMSPQTLVDQGGREALQSALQNFSAYDEPTEARRRHPFFTGNNIATDPESQVSSEVTTRAPSVVSDGDYQQAENTNLMEMFVDPYEVDGLPSVNPERDVERNRQAAEALVRAHTTGMFGFMRRRKKSSKQGQDNFTAGEDGLWKEAIELSNKDEDGTGDFGRKLREGREPGTTYESTFGVNLDVPPSAAIARGKGIVAGAGGVLSSLLALQSGQQRAESVSIVSTPASSRPPSRRSSTLSDDSEEDEEERTKFIREHRIKNGWNPFGSGSGNNTPGLSSKYTRLSSSTTTPIRSSTDGKDQPSSPGLNSSTGSKNHSRQYSTISQFIQGRSTAPLGSPRADKKSPSADARSTKALALEPGMLARRPSKTSRVSAVTSRVKKLGETLGLEVETSSSRPYFAKSSAGVFGGLIATTGNLAGIAAPVASQLAPDAHRPGFHLTRLSSPPPKPPKSPKSPKSPRSPPSNSKRPSSFHSFSHRPSSITSSPTTSTFPTNKDLVESLSAPNSPDAGDLHLSQLDPPPISIGPPVRPRTTSPGHPMARSFTLDPPSSTPSRPAGATHSTSFSENAMKRRSASGFKQIESLALNMMTAPLKLTKSKAATTPDSRASGEYADYFGHHQKSPKPVLTQEEREKKEWEKEKRRRRKAKEKRRREQIFITQHVAAILERQDFLLKLTRALMCFGAPTHRLEAQMQATARILELNCQMILLPGIFLVSFGDPATHTSEVKFLKQANGLDLGKLLDAHMVYYQVVHDKMGVTEASAKLDELMTSKAAYKLWQQLLIGGLASAFIQPSAFYGSLIDCLVTIPLGMLLVLVQVLVSKNDLYSSLFELVIASLNAFLAAALSKTGVLCFSAMTSGSVVLILPGYIVLCGSLELCNRSIISGSVRLVYSVLYSLFLGFGLSIGSEIFIRVTGSSIPYANEYQCTTLRANAPWYRATISPWFFFLTAPAYLACLALRNGQPIRRKELPVMILTGCAGFSCNYFSGRVFVNRPDITSAIGAFVVGLLGGLYSKFTRGSAFVIMVVGILFQLPSGLSNGGLLRFASESTSGTTDYYSSGFLVAEQLIQTAIGLTVGLFVAAAVTNFIGGGRRRGLNLSSF